MAAAETKPRPRFTCCLCGHSSRDCKCPWEKPFEEWPIGLMQVVQRLVANQYLR